MANIKSQKKRILTAEKARQRNRAVKSQLKTAVRRVREAVEAKDGVQAYVAAQEACRLLDKAASKGVIHKNQAANRKSGVMALANTVVTAEDIAAAPKREKKMPVAKDGGKKAAKKAEKKAAYEAAAKEKAVRREATLKAEAAAHEAKAKAEAEAAAAEAAEGAEEAAE
ncbi:MAG: 30S ribosomal protein S20 [Slackia sp.]|nr:30S ribosomal protein S20 [Slackia sp.]